MKQTATLNDLATIIAGAKRIAIMGHKGGDGDCYGAAFGLAAALNKLGKEAKIIVNEEFPESLNFLFFYFSGELVHEMQNVDLLILLDSSTINRVANVDIAKSLMSAGIKTIQIDHHKAEDLNDLVDFSYATTKTSSTSELVFALIRTLGVEIDKKIATCLLTGIISDTSSFQNHNTSEDSFAISSELMKHGARLTTITNNLFNGKDVDVLKVWGLAMERLNVSKKLGIVSTYLTYEDIEQYGLSPSAISGIVNFLNSIKGANVVLLVAEEERGTIKVSLRTREEHVDVANLARQLGGGGHVKASGFCFPGTLKTLTVNGKSHIVIV